MLSAENQYAKQKLNLARAIGLPIGQEFALTDKIPYGPLESVTPEEARARAYSSRSDYRSAMAQVRAAERARKAAAAELRKAGSVPAGAPGRAADDASQG